MKIKYLFRFYNYPRYITDFILIGFYVFYWKKRDILIGNKTNFLGIPIISNEKNAIIKIGKNCLICSRSSQTALGIAHPTILRTLKSKSTIYIGNNVRMSGTTICAAKKVEIGENCVIGADVIISDTDFHSLNPAVRRKEHDAELANVSPVIIGKDVFIGAKSIILKGVSIGKSSVIGAGSVVTKSFNENSIIAGNPAKLIGTINELNNKE